MVLHPENSDRDEGRESAAQVDSVVNDPDVRNLLGGLFGRPAASRVAILRRGAPDDSPEKLEERLQALRDAEKRLDLR